MSGQQRVVIVGNGQVAELALARLRRDTALQVAGFAVDRAYIRSPELLGLPVHAFEDIASHYPPDTHLAVVAIGPTAVNRIRAERFDQARALGYRFVNLISPRASVWPGVVMGENCTIGDGCVIQPYTRLGDNVHVGSGSVVGHHVVLEDHCYLAASVALAGSVTIGRAALLGVGAVVRDRVRVGAEAVLGAGVVLSGHAQARAVYAAPQPVLLPVSSDKLPL
ncbi:MAG: acetyltransferase [Inhella sp.]